MDERLDYPATRRNREPIAEAMADHLPPTGTVLEIASGSGQHAVHFAAKFPGLTFQPSDCDERNLVSIRAWIADSGLSNLQQPLLIDATEGQFPVPDSSVDVVFNANMVHISPWEACLGLLKGSAQCLRQGGMLIMYGPYQLGGTHTAPSNAAFDQDLRSRDPRWGVRHLEEVQQIAESHRLTLQKRIPMPANNQLVCYRRG